MIARNKISLINEIGKMFPKEKIIQLSRWKSSDIFSSEDKIIKYLPKEKLDTYLKIFNLLNQKTDIRIPKILGLKASVMSNGSFVIMEKQGDNVLKNVWNDFNEHKKKIILERMANLLKKINSIFFEPEEIYEFLIFFSKNLGWKEEVKKFCILNLDEYRKKGFIGDSLYKSLYLILDSNIDYIQNTNYVLLHRDLHFSNLLIDKNLNLTLLFDFETFSAGDKFLDLVISSSFLEKKYRKMFLNYYGVSNNFNEIAKVYRLVLLLNFLKNASVVEEEALKFIKNGFPSFVKIQENAILKNLE